MANASKPAVFHSIPGLNITGINIQNLAGNVAYNQG